MSYLETHSKNSCQNRNIRWLINIALGSLITVRILLGNWCFLRTLIISILITEQYLERKAHYNNILKQTSLFRSLTCEEPKNRQRKIVVTLRGAPDKTNTPKATEENPMVLPPVRFEVTNWDTMMSHSMTYCMNVCLFSRAHKLRAWAESIYYLCMF